MFRDRSIRGWIVHPDDTVVPIRDDRGYAVETVQPEKVDTGWRRVTTPLVAVLAGKRDLEWDLR
jgi:hypothetical protein